MLSIIYLNYKFVKTIAAFLKFKMLENLLICQVGDKVLFTGTSTIFSYVKQIQYYSGNSIK